MRKISAFIATALMLIVGFRYSWLTWQGEIQPVLATWLLFLVAVFLSFMTYWSTEKHSFTGNIINTTDLFNMCLIMFSIIVLGKNTILEFNAFDISCLVASGIILVFWRLSKMHVIANLALQGIMTVAYFPTIYRLWHTKTNTEQFGVWILVWIASAVALIPAYINRDKLGMIYASRSLTMVSVVLILMLIIYF